MSFNVEAEVKINKTVNYQFHRSSAQQRGNWVGKYIKFWSIELNLAINKS